jgi:RNA polymerase sigma-70 factor (ECF subfamily)
MNDDQNLLQRISSMDGEALARVYDLYAPAIYRYAYRHSSNALLADQTVGEVFARLLEQLSQGRGPRSNLRAYLFEIAYHAIVDEVRYARRMQPLRAAELAFPGAGDPGRELEQRMLLEVVRQAMHEDLTDDQRHVIILRFLEDFSLKETARIMQKKVGNIKVIQQRAVTALRRALDHRHALPQGAGEQAALPQ